MIVMTDAHLRIIKHPVLVGTSQDMTQPVIEAEALDWAVRSCQIWSTSLRARTFVITTQKRSRSVR
jgi:hypothetical protein